MNELTTARDISTIATEIRLIQQDVQQYASQAAMRIGERLTEAKELVPFGEWGEWVKNEFGWSQDRANQLMAVYREYGGTQKNLFGAELNSDTYRNLSFSKLLALISVPESEREAFIKESDAENISVRELKKAIAEKAEAEEQASAERATRIEAESINAELQEKLRQTADELKAASSQAEKNEQKLKARINELESQPAKVITQRDETAIKVAVAKAEKAAADELEKVKKELESISAAAKENADAADKALAEKQKLSEQLRQIQTRETMSAPEITTFKVYFENVQTEIAKMKELIRQLAAADAEAAQRLRNALKALAAAMENEA